MSDQLRYRRWPQSGFSAGGSRCAARAARRRPAHRTSREWPSSRDTTCRVAALTRPSNVTNFPTGSDDGSDRRDARLVGSVERHESTQDCAEADVGRSPYARSPRCTNRQPEVRQKNRFTHQRGSHARRRTVRTRARPSPGLTGLLRKNAAGSSDPLLATERGSPCRRDRDRQVAEELVGVLGFDSLR